MKFQYTHLPPGSVRVFRFSQYATPSFLHIWIEHIEGFARGQVPFVAIRPQSASGTAVAKRESIILNGRSFLVPGWLFDALQAIVTRRASISAETCMYYWAEDICVNQASEAERIEGRQSIPAVLRIAHQILVWVDDLDENHTYGSHQCLVRGRQTGSLSTAENTDKDHKVEVESLQSIMHSAVEGMDNATHANVAILTPTRQFTMSEIGDGQET